MWPFKRSESQKKLYKLRQYIIELLDNDCFNHSICHYCDRLIYQPQYITIDSSNSSYNIQYIFIDSIEIPFTWWDLFIIRQHLKRFYERDRMCFVEKNKLELNNIIDKILENNNVAVSEVANDKTS